MILFNIGVLPYDQNLAYNALKQVSKKNALKKENKIILFKFRRADKNILSERDRIRDQISSYSIDKLNMIMILIKFDRIPIMKDQIKSLLLPLVKVKDQILIMIDQFYTSEDKDQDYKDIQYLIHYFKLKVFILYLDNDQVINDIFNSLINFDQNQILELSDNQNEDQITLQNITKQLNDIHQRIITKNLLKTNKKKSKKQKKSDKQNKQNKKYEIQEEIKSVSSQRELQLETQEKDQSMKTEITDILCKGINQVKHNISQNVQPYQTSYQFDFYYEANQPEIQYQIEDGNDQFDCQQNYFINDNPKKKEGGWCNLI